MTELPSLPVLLDELLLRLACPLLEEVRELIFKLAGRPGENQTILLLDLWDGDVPVKVMRQARWHRRHLLNEPNEERFRLVSQEIEAHWGSDSDLRLQNLSTQECLAQLPDGAIMLAVAAQSMWEMSNVQLQECLKVLNRCLHHNGCVVLLAPVQPREPELSDQLSDRLAPRGSLLRRMIAERLAQIPSRTDEDFQVMFLEAELDYECVLKCYPFQCWLLTHTRQFRSSTRLFSVF